MGALVLHLLLDPCPALFVWGKGAWCRSQGRSTSRSSTAMGQRAEHMDPDPAGVQMGGTGLASAFSETEGVRPPAENEKGRAVWRS